MSDRAQAPLTVSLQVLSGAAAVMAALMGALVLAGWALNVTALKSVAPGLATMKANTALAFLLSGVALWLLREKRAGRYGARGLVAARALALAVAVIGLLSLSESLLGWDLGIDQILFRDSFQAVRTFAPGRMAPATAFNFLLVGLALLLLDVPSGAADYPALTVGSVSLIAVIGYAYDVKALYSVGPYGSVAVHTALGFVVLCCGILAARPERGLMALVTSAQPGGTLVRRLLLPAVAMPIVIGWVRLQGQRASLYGTEFGIALFAMSNVIVFVVLVSWTAQSLNRGDRQRQQAEKALHAAQQRLAHVVSSSPAVLYSLKVEGREHVPTWTSENIVRLLGYTPAEIGGTDWWVGHVHPEDRESVVAQMPKLLAEGYLAREYRFLNKDSTYCWVGDEQRLLRDPAGNPVEVVGSWSDVTPRKRAELRLQESEEQYRLLFDSNPQPMWVYDEESLTFLAVNDAAIHHYGYSRAEFLAMTIRNIHPIEEAELLDEHVAKRLREGDQRAFHSSRVWKHRKKDASLIDVETAVSPIEFLGRHALLTLASDVTEKKRLETQLLQSQKMDSVGRLAGGVAHDFNNLLGVITGYGELLRKRIPDEPHVRRYVGDILKAAERAAGLTRQLLAFSRKQVLQPRILDLNTVVGEMEKMLGRLIGEDIQLVTVFAAGLRRVKADPGQMEQVLMNLAVNARDAMPRGGRLTIETANIDLDAAYARSRPGVKPGPHVMLAVSDTGHGMDQEVLGHIFEPFFTTKEAGKGTGLGLATVHGIVKQSGGHIFVYSEREQGTTFKVYLPRLEGAETVVEATPADEAGLQRGSETVLLVEDEESLRNIVREILEGTGYTVIEARHAGHALEIAERHPAPIPLLITDVVMPGMSGSDLATHLAASHPETRVLYMSGYTDDAVVLHGVLAADMAFLQKPFTAEVLARKVREVLDR